MRIAAMIVALLGLFGPAFVGFIWQAEISKVDQQVQTYKKMAESEGSAVAAKFNEGMRAYTRLTQTTLFLLVAIPLGLFGAILAFLGRGISAGVLLLAVSVGPGLLAPDEKTRMVAFGFSGLLMLGGLLAFFARPPQPKLALKRSGKRDDDHDSGDEAVDEPEGPPRRRRPKVEAEDDVDEDA